MSANFPTTPGAFQPHYGGVSNAFVTKLNATGTALIYSTYLGGSNGDGANGIAVDSSGNAYVTGGTSSANFPTTTGAFQTSYNGGNNAFVTKLNATGTSLIYSTYLGLYCDASGIAVDASGNAYVTGGTDANFPTTAGAFQTSYGGNGNSDAFVTKLNATGTALIYSTYLGGSGGDQANGIAVDSAGNAYVAGFNQSDDFPTTVGAFQTSYSGNSNAFVTKLNVTGTSLIYSTYLGQNCEAYGIAVDASGNAYVSGGTDSNFPITAGAFQTSYGGNGNAFVTKLNAAGTALIYSTYLGGNNNDLASGIAVNGSGNAYLTGVTGSANFPTTTGAFQTSYGGGPEDAFLTQLNSTGTALIYSTYLGGSNDDVANGIAVDGSGNAYVVGSTASSNFPTTTGAYQTSYGGGTYEAFVAKFSFALPANQLVISNLSSTSVTAGGTVTFTVTAEDSNNNPVPSYTGTIKLTSTDNNALYNGASLPATYTFVASDSGSHTFTVTLQSAGSQKLTITDQANSSLTAATNPITVSAGAVGKFALGVVGGNTVVAGTSFLLTAQAVDAFGNPVSSYNGPSSITATASPSDPEVNYSITSELNSSGFAFFLGTLQMAGSYTITAGGGTTNVTVAPASTDYFTFAAPSSAATGAAFNVTVKTFDRFGNPTPAYTGTVSLTSTDPQAPALSSYTFTAADAGVHTFSVTLKSSTLGGSTGTTLFARDTSATSPPITGFSTPITVQGLVVVPGGFVVNPTGFTVTFSEPVNAANLTMYGSNNTTVQDVTLVGAGTGLGAANTSPYSIPGTLYIDPSSPNTIVFKASSAALQAFNNDGIPDLPDDTYTVTLVSGTGNNGFVDALGNHLDGLGNGTAANWTTTFTTSYQEDGRASAVAPTPILAIPDFARGPWFTSGASSTITVPNNKANRGIPVTIYNAPTLTDATFTLTYNPQIFTPTGAGIGDALAGSTFTMGTIIGVDSTHSTVTFTYHNPTANSGTLVLGDILAMVPNSAASIYKTKELLALSNISITGGATVLASDGIHVDAYLGDVHVTAAPAIDASDALDAENVASGAWTGFSAYTLLDPAIIGGFIAGHTVSVDPADVTALFTEAAHGNVPQLPSIPSGVTVSTGGADPTVSLGSAVQTTGGIVSVPVLLDDPKPVGSTGMTEAHLALNDDPKIVSGAPADDPASDLPVQVAGQMFQIGNAPALNSLLHGNSPCQSAANQLFLALAGGKGALAEFNVLSLFQDNLWDGAAQHPDWLAIPSQSSATDPSASTLDERAAAGQDVSGRLAAVDRVFAALGEEMDKTGDNGQS